MVCITFLLQSWPDFSVFLPLEQHWVLSSPLWFFAYSYLRAFYVEIKTPKTEKLFTSIKQETLQATEMWGSKPRGKRHGWQHKSTSTRGQPTGSSNSLRSSAELVQSKSATQNYNLLIDCQQHRGWRTLYRPHIESLLWNINAMGGWTFPISYCLPM